MLRTSQQRSPGAVACRQGVATRVRTRANQFDRWAQRRRARTHTFGQRRRAAQAPAPPAVSSTLGTPLAAPFSKAVLAPRTGEVHAVTQRQDCRRPRGRCPRRPLAARGTGLRRRRARGGPLLDAAAPTHSFAAWCLHRGSRARGRRGSSRAALLCSAPALRVWLVASAASIRLHGDICAGTVIAARVALARPAPPACIHRS